MNKVVIAMMKVIILYGLFLSTSQAQQPDGKKVDAYIKAVENAKVKVNKFKDAIRSKDPVRIKKADLAIQADPAAVKELNKESPSIIKQSVDVTNNIKRDTINSIKKEYTKKYNKAHPNNKIVPDDVEIVEFTNPNSIIKKGHDWDLTVRVKGKDVPFREVEDTVYESYFDAAGGKKAYPNSSPKEFARGHHVEPTSRHSAEAYEGGMDYINNTGSYKVSDPERLSKTMEHKAELDQEKAANYADKDLLTSEVYRGEQARQYVKQYDKHIKPRIKEMHGRIPDTVQEGTKILGKIGKNDTELGRIYTPADADAALAKLGNHGETIESIVRKGSALVESAQKIKGPTMEHVLKKKLGHAYEELDNAFQHGDKKAMRKARNKIKRTKYELKQEKLKSVTAESGQKIKTPAYAPKVETARLPKDARKFQNSVKKLEWERMQAHKKLSAQGGTTAQHKAIDDRILNKARQLERIRTKALERLAKKAGLKEITQGKYGTKPTKGRGALGDIDTDSFSGKDFEKIRVAAKEAGYTVTGDGDTLHIKELDTTVHRKSTKFKSKLGSSAAESEEAGGYAKESSRKLKTGDKTSEVLDNLGKSGNTLKKPIKNFKSSDWQEMGKMTGRNMDASGLKDKKFREQLKALKEGYRPESVGIEDQEAFQKKCREMNNRAAKRVRTAGNAKEARLEKKLENANKEIEKARKNGNSKKFKEATNKAKRTKIELKKHKQTQKVAKDSLRKNQPQDADEFLKNTKPAKADVETQIKEQSIQEKIDRAKADMQHAKKSGNSKKYNEASERIKNAKKLRKAQNEVKRTQQELKNEIKSNESTDIKPEKISKRGSTKEGGTTKETSTKPSETIKGKIGENVGEYMEGALVMGQAQKAREGIKEGDSEKIKSAFLGEDTAKRTEGGKKYNSDMEKYESAKQEEVLSALTVKLKRMGATKKEIESFRKNYGKDSKKIANIIEVVKARGGKDTSSHRSLSADGKMDDEMSKSVRAIEAAKQTGSYGKVILDMMSMGGVTHGDESKSDLSDIDKQSDRVLTETENLVIAKLYIELRDRGASKEEAREALKNYSKDRSGVSKLVAVLKERDPQKAKGSGTHKKGLSADNVDIRKDDDGWLARVEETFKKAANSTKKMLYDEPKKLVVGTVKDLSGEGGSKYNSDMDKYDSAKKEEVMSVLTRKLKRMGATREEIESFRENYGKDRNKIAKIINDVKSRGGKDAIGQKPLDANGKMDDEKKSKIEKYTEEKYKELKGQYNRKREKLLELGATESEAEEALAGKAGSVSKLIKALKKKQQKENEKAVSKEELVKKEPTKVGSNKDKKTPKSIRKPAKKELPKNDNTTKKLQDKGDKAATDKISINIGKIAEGIEVALPKYKPIKPKKFKIEIQAKKHNIYVNQTELLKIVNRDGKDPIKVNWNCDNSYPDGYEILPSKGNNAYFIGTDVGNVNVSICATDADGKIAKEAIKIKVLASTKSLRYTGPIHYGDEVGICVDSVNDNAECIPSPVVEEIIDMKDYTPRQPNNGKEFYRYPYRFKSSPAGVTLNSDGIIEFNALGNVEIWYEVYEEHRGSKKYIGDTQHIRTTILPKDNSPVDLNETLEKKSTEKPSEQEKLELTLKAVPKNKVVLGEEVKIKAAVNGGVPPYKYSWSGVEGEEEVISFKPTKAGTHKISVKVTDANKSSAEKSIDIIAEVPTFTITGLPFKNLYSSKTTLTINTNSDMSKNKPIWQADKKGILFDPPEGIRTSVTFANIGDVNIWAYAVDKKGKTLLESKRVHTRVTVPDFSLKLKEKTPLVGVEDTVTISTQAKIDNEYFGFRWLPMGKNIQMLGESDKGRSYRFKMKNTNKTTLNVLVWAQPYAEKQIVNLKQIVSAKTYQVSISKPKRLDKAPWRWDPKQGKAVELPQAIAVFQNAEVHCKVTPKPKEKLRYQWTVTPKGCTISAPMSKSTYLNAHETGTYTVSVEVKDKNNVVLGKGRTSYTVTVSQRDLDVAKQKSKDQKKAKALLFKSRKFWKEGKLQQAIAKVAQAQKLAGKDKEIAKTLKAMQMQKKELDTKLDKASNLIKNGKLKDAEAILSQAARISDKYKRYKEVSKQLADAKKKAEEKKKQIAKLLKDAKALKDAGKLDEAVALLAKGIKQFPGNKEIDKLLKEVQKQQRDALSKMAEGEAKWKKGLLGKAISTLKEAAKIDPSNKKIVKALKGMQGQKKMIDNALNKADRLIKEKKFDQAKSALVKAGYISKKYPPYIEMVKKLDDAKKKDEQLANELLKKAKGLWTAGKLNDAMALLTKGSKEFAAHKQISQSLQKMQQNKKKLDSLIGRAEKLINQKKFGKADSLLKKAGKISKRYPPYIEAMKKLKQQKKKDEEERIAREDARKKMAEGERQWKNGLLDKAVSTLKEAAKIDTSNKKIAKVLKDMQGQKKMVDDALSKADRLIKQKKFEQAQNALKKVEYIGNKYKPYIKMEKNLKHEIVEPPQPSKPGVVQPGQKPPKEIKPTGEKPSSKISSLVGSWSFGRSKHYGKPVQEHLCNLTLTDEHVKGIGYKIKSCHPNESYWILEGKVLLFVALDGTITTKFTEVRSNYWEGTFVGNTNEGIVHYLRKSDKNTEDETSQSDTTAQTGSKTNGDEASQTGITSVGKGSPRDLGEPSTVGKGTIRSSDGSANAGNSRESLTINKKVYEPNEQIRLNFTSAPEQNAWIGMYDSKVKHTYDAANITYQNSDAKASGERVFGAPNSEGEYQFRLFGRKNRKELVVLPFTVKVDKDAASLTINKKIYEPNEKIQLNFKATTLQNAWIGMYESKAKHAYDASNLSWQNCDSKASGNREFGAPQKEGAYQFRLYERTNHKELLVLPFTVKVKKEAATLKFDKNVYESNEKIKLHFTATPLQNAWIGMYKSATKHTYGASNITWQNCDSKASGVREFTAPKKSGSYQFRLYERSNKKELVVLPFTVKVKKTDKETKRIEKEKEKKAALAEKIKAIRRAALKAQKEAEERAEVRRKEELAAKIKAIREAAEERARIQDEKEKKAALAEKIRRIREEAEKKAEKPKTEQVDNIGGVVNGPKKPTTFRFIKSVKLLFLQTYHWNYGRGVTPPGKIGLRHSDGTMYGPWQTRGSLGQGGVPNAYWEVNPNVPLKPGVYTVVDSDPKTWSTNAQEGWKGFAVIRTGPLDYPDEKAEGTSAREETRRIQTEKEKKVELTEIDQTIKNNDVVSIKNPKVNGVALDYCREWAKNCGKPAADAWCQANGYSGSISYVLKNNAPPTRIISTKKICKSSFCGRIVEIKCRHKVADGAIKDRAEAEEKEAALAEKIRRIRKGTKQPSNQSNAITILSATYGANCGMSSGNVTPHIAKECNGKSSCRYTVDYKKIGDPAIGCRKTYSVQYRCGNNPQVLKGSLTAEAGWGDKSILLDCRQNNQPEDDTLLSNISSLVGSWKWFDGETIHIYPNGTATDGFKGKWQANWNGSGFTYTINWNNGQYIDSLVLHGDTLDGHNQNGTHVWGKRITSSQHNETFREEAERNAVKAQKKIKSTARFMGTLLGSWKGPWDVHGSFQMKIAENGKISGSYWGDEKGRLSGSVSSSGKLNVKSGRGRAGSGKWGGTITVDSNGRLHGKGTWNVEGYKGSWHGR